MRRVIKLQPATHRAKELLLNDPTFSHTCHPLLGDEAARKKKKLGAPPGEGVN